jgi:hypothetical protein
MIVVFGMAAGCSSHRAILCNHCHMVVELDIFSGQPNPRWELSREQARILQEKLLLLPARSGPAHMFDGLGYRGVIVHDVDEQRSYMKVGFGWVVRSESVYEDQGRMLERWLLSTGKGRIDDRLLAAINLN